MIFFYTFILCFILCIVRAWNCFHKKFFFLLQWRSVYKKMSLLYCVILYVSYFKGNITDVNCDVTFWPKPEDCTLSVCPVPRRQMRLWRLCVWICYCSVWFEYVKFGDSCVGVHMLFWLDRFSLKHCGSDLISMKEKKRKKSCINCKKQYYS